MDRGGWIDFLVQRMTGRLCKWLISGTREYEEVWGKVRDGTVAIELWKVLHIVVWYTGWGYNRYFGDGRCRCRCSRWHLCGRRMASLREQWHGQTKGWGSIGHNTSKPMGVRGLTRTCTRPKPVPRSMGTGFDQVGYRFLPGMDTQGTYPCRKPSQSPIWLVVVVIIMVFYPNDSGHILWHDVTVFGRWATTLIGDMYVLYNS
jgi:hypothetical protein